MSRRISIQKINNITLVTVNEKGRDKTVYSSIRRNVEKHLNGVIIKPNPEEAAFNNFYIPLNELEDTFGAKDSDDLVAQFAARGFFSGASNSSTPGASISQNNKIIVIELPAVFITKIGISKEEALATQLNEYSDLDVKEDEILIIKVGRFIQGGATPGES
ncbi:hypothetical protein [Tenacibaculum aiptasiae]|uniref:hypothetical protein n=1 Tax=Tenacibaculum aiptasiae TaxID=426481 RepID=UPI00232FEFB8|nr:hypothetical protein [Tenacibaculum aiptasiae]